MTHSPAPWKWEDSALRSGDDNLILFTGDDSGTDFTPFHADASLIAAAPDLLYAAQRAVLVFASLANGVMVDESVIKQSGRELYAAISKAEPNEIT